MFKTVAVVSMYPTVLSPARKPLALSGDSFVGVLLLSCALLPVVGLAQTGFWTAPAPLISEEDEQSQWDLRDLYPTTEAWDSAQKKVKQDMQELQACKGKVAVGKNNLVRCLTRFTAVLQELLKVHTYAHLGADVDLNDTEWQRRAQQASLLYNDIQKIAGFYEPELIARGKKILNYTRPGKELENYDFYLSDLLRRSAHTLSAEEEKLLAEAAGPTQEFEEAYSVLMNAEIPWPKMATPQGDELLLNAQGYAIARQSLDRDYRALAFESFFGRIGQFSQTLGNLLSGQVRSQVFVARARGFKSALAARLDTDNLPETVYLSLVEAVNNTLPSLHRYFRFRQRMLGLRQLRYYDIYPPLIPSLQKVFPLKEGEKLMLKAVEPFGADYGKRLTDSLDRRWVDVYPKPGKRSGAYMSGNAYDTHPYILLNYNESFADVSTLVHEWGHAIHSLYSNENQPFTKADYSTFTAELAAILPQVLLLDHMIENSETPEERLYYLSEAMEDIRGTFYRQTMFAEFEQRIHEKAEAGEVLDATSLSDTYYALARKYHGAERGIVQIPSYIKYEWAYIPHFYYNFYVFQYATSMAAAFYLSEEIRKQKEPAAERFIGILEAGGSDYPYELLRKAGIDMANVDVYKAVARRLDHLLNTAEKTLAEIDGRNLP